MNKREIRESIIRSMTILKAIFAVLLYSDSPLRPASAALAELVRSFISRNIKKIEMVKWKTRSWDAGICLKNLTS